METTSKWFGVYKREKKVFISLNLQHIEIYECVKLFGIKVWDREKEVHIPPLTKLSKENLQTIYEAYEELFETIKEIKGGRK